MSRQTRKGMKVTGVDQKRNVTTGQQINVRLTNLEQDAYSLLVEKVQDELPNKKITRSLIIRAFGHTHDEPTVIKKLVKSIKDNL